MMSSRRAVFLDRDGVVNPLLYHRDAGIVDSPFTVEQFRVFPHVPRAIRLLNDLGVLVILVSNQPGIAKRHFTAATLRQFDRKLQACLKRAGAHLDAVYYCLHHPDAIVKQLRQNCDCRKPRIGMLLKAADDFGVTLTDSYMIGDGLTDIEAGSRAGCRTIFIGRWKPEYSQFIKPPDLRPDFIAKELREAARIISDDLSSSSRTKRNRVPGAGVTIA